MTPISLVVAVLVFLAIFFLFRYTQKQLHLSLRKNSVKIKAIVVEYRKERIKSIRNDFTKIEYPYVRLKNGSSKELHCLRHASSGIKYYKLGDEVDVFWNDGKLLAWNI